MYRICKSLPSPPYSPSVVYGYNFLIEADDNLLDLLCLELDSLIIDEDTLALVSAHHSLVSVSPRDMQ